MNKKLLIPVILWLAFVFAGSGQLVGTADFTFGNVSYFSLNIGDTCTIGDDEIELLSVDRHYNRFRFNIDTVWLKVARRSPAITVSNFHVFVADNIMMRKLSGCHEAHGLLQKDVLLGISSKENALIEPLIFSFPVAFTKGFIWRNLEETYMFAYQPRLSPGRSEACGGVGIDVRDTRSMEKHLIAAMENGRVVWIETAATPVQEAAVCIESESSPGFYYIYEHLSLKSLAVKRNQRIIKGDGVGFASGAGTWGHFRLGVVRSDTVPAYSARYRNTVNFYPQLLDLYYGRQPLYSNSFTKGQIYFGRPENIQGNVKNISAIEEHHGMGWKLGRWNAAAMVECVTGRRTGNARLRKTLFRGQPGECTNPNDWYEYEINVRNGIYRIRALVGDIFEKSWQKVEFEGINAGTFQCEPGEMEWTSERIVKVEDGKLTVKIYTSGTMTAGLSEIVFQQAQP
jgi:hypothetical protein